MTAQTTGPNTRDMSKPDPFYGYAGLSVMLHWVTALIVLTMALSGGVFHLSVGLLLGAVLVWRVVWRWSRGFPRVSDQPIIINVIERLAKIIILASLMLLAFSGFLLPLVEAAPYTVFDIITWQSPLEFNALASTIVRSIHAYAAWALYAAIGVHLLAAVKHIITSKDGVLLRIVKPVIGGK